VLVFVQGLKTSQVYLRNPLPDGVVEIWVVISREPFYECSFAGLQHKNRQYLHGAATKWDRNTI
jgi:hypothetical protein